MCGGARLKLEALLWRMGFEGARPMRCCPGAARMRRWACNGRARSWSALPGLSLHDLMLLPIERVRRFFGSLTLAPPGDEALKLLLDEIRTRLKYLCDVGLGYLTLDRQSRTLSGGEVQRINLTTALGTSLVNTMFVLDEPSIGLHPRDMDRIVEAMHRPARRRQHAGGGGARPGGDADRRPADRHGPGPGERAGRSFDGAPDAARQADADRRLPWARQAGGHRAAALGDDETPKLILEGVREHNLKNISVSLPLQRPGEGW